MTGVATTAWNMRKYEFSPTRILPYKDKIYDISENPYSRVFHSVNIQRITIFQCLFISGNNYQVFKSRTIFVVHSKYLRAVHACFYKQHFYKQCQAEIGNAPIREQPWRCPSWIGLIDFRTSPPIHTLESTDIKISNKNNTVVYGSYREHALKRKSLKEQS